MATLDWFSGYDGYTNAELSSGDTPVFTATSSSGISTTSGEYRTGRAGFEVAWTAYGYKTGLTNRVTYYLGSWLSIDNASLSNHAFMALSDGAPTTAGNVQISLARNTSTGKIEVYRGRALASSSGGTLLGSSTNALSVATGTTIVLRVTVDASAGIVEVFVNGSKNGWINLTGQNTQSTANAYANAFGLSGLSLDTHWDDSWLSATNAGDVRVLPNWATTGNGTYTAFTTSTGSDHGALVDEQGANNGDTDYNKSTASGNKESYNLASLTVPGSIHAVKLHNATKRQDAGYASVKYGFRIGGADYLGAERFLPTTYTVHSEQYDTDPSTSAAWATRPTEVIVSHYS